MSYAFTLIGAPGAPAAEGAASGTARRQERRIGWERRRETDRCNSKKYEKKKGMNYRRDILFIVLRVVFFQDDMSITIIINSLFECLI